jgi:hypothetical protein
LKRFILQAAFRFFSRSAFMKFTFSRWIVVVIGLACPMLAQDSHYRPERQQIPFPTCLTMKGAWEGG